MLPCSYHLLAWIRVLRAIAGLILFNAAYMAENVRGGLQAMPRGQTEAGSALGLSTPLVVSLIVLPQALRRSSQHSVSLLGYLKILPPFAVGLLELTGIARSDFWRSPVHRSLCGGLFIHWFNLLGLLLRNVCSQRLERKLNIGQH